MTHHSNHPAVHITTLPNHHPRPVVHPYIPAETAIPGRSSIVPFPPHGRKDVDAVLLAGQVGHLGVQLRSATNTGGSASTRAHLHAQGLIAEIQKELGQIGGRNILSPRLRSLRKDLDYVLRTIELHNPGQVPVRT